MLIENIRRHWVWGLVPIIFTAVGLFWQYKSARHELGGILNATFHSRTLGNKDSRTIVVCVDDTTQHLRDLYITPTFDNQDEYTLRDFSLIYEVTSKNVKILPSEFVSVYNPEKETVYFRYNQDVLNAHMDTKNPLSGFVMQGDIARCEIVSKVSFDGAASLFEYRTDVWFVYKPNEKNLSFDYWKLSCKQKVFEMIDDKTFDIYYISNNEKPEYQFDVILSNNKKTQKVHTIDSSKKESIVDSSNKALNNNDAKKDNLEENINVDDSESKVDDKEFVSIKRITTEEEKRYADLSIDDYKIEHCDSTIITLFFDHPANISGDYILTYLVKDGWFMKTVFKHLFIESGQKGCTFAERGEIHKIAKPTLLHPVNPDEHIKIERNFNGYFCVTPLKGRPMLRLNYDGQGHFFRQVGENGYSTHFKNEVNIEVFDTNINLSVLFFFFVDNYLYIIGAGLVFLLFFGLIKNADVSIYFFYLSMGLLFLCLAIVLVLALCIFFQFVGCYIKLMI